jgi:hypothetical protein
MSSILIGRNSFFPPLKVLSFTFRLIDRISPGKIHLSSSEESFLIVLAMSFAGFHVCQETKKIFSAVRWL